MEKALETGGKVIFETWGGPWETAPEFRRVQSRDEARRVIEAIRYDLQAKMELVAFLMGAELFATD